MKLRSVMVYLTIFIELINGLLIRSNNVYEHVITDIQKYYQSDYIFIFYSSPKNETVLDGEVITRLINLQFYFNKNFIYANIIDINKITDQQYLKIKIIRNNLKTSLFVFLDDLGEEKSLFQTLLVPLFDTSMYRWLFFFDNNMAMDEFFMNTYIPFDSNCLVSITDSDNCEVITEIYRISEDDDLRKNIIALWNPDDGIQLFETQLYQRRKNLFGHHFRATTIREPPTTKVSRGQNNEIQLDGIIGTLMEHLKKELNFTITYRLTTTYGARLENGSWTGGIADLVNNVSDIFATSIAMTPLRKDAIDFSMPIFFADDCFFLKKPIKDYVEWNKFLKPFQKDVWITIIFLIIITSSLVTLILSFYKRLDEQILTKNRESCFISDNVFVIYGAFCGQAIRRSLINSVFIIHVTLHITATIILAAYSAILISTLTVSNFEAPFQTLQDFFQDGTYRMGFIKSSVYSDIFKVSNDSVIKKIYDIAVKYDTMTSTIREGLYRMCNEPKYAFIAPKFVGYTVRTKYCTLVPSKVVLKLSKCLGLRKHLPFRELINYHIALMKKHGILDRIVKEAIKISPQKENEPWEAVQLVDVVPLLVLLFINIVLSFIILLIEKQMYKKFKQQRLFNISQFTVQRIKNMSKKKKKKPLLLLKI